MKAIAVLLGSLVGRAECRRRSVGALLVKQGKVVGCGWNALPRKASCLAGECPRGLLSYEEQPADVGYAATGCTAIHAEDRAILSAGARAVGSTCYVTAEPCPGCAELLRRNDIPWVVVDLESVLPAPTPLP